jgi:hypothetical protein
VFFPNHFGTAHASGHNQPYRYSFTRLTPIGVSKAKPASDLTFALIFRVFTPENTCQALKPPNPLPDNNIRMAF